MRPDVPAIVTRDTIPKVTSFRDELCAAVSLAQARIRLGRRVVVVVLCFCVMLSGACKRQEKAKEAVPSRQDIKVDLDLTAVNQMMAFTQVFYMIQKPQDYAGQLIRMSGKCTITKNRHTQERHYNCNVTDSTGCCATMIRFNLGEGNLKPPRNGDNITIRGRFEIVTERGKSFGLLQNAVLE